MRLVVVGAGGHGRETMDVAEAAARAGQDWQVLGVVDDGPLDDEAHARLARRGTAYLGPLDELPALDASYVVAIGDPATRQAVVTRLGALGCHPAPALVHPDAVLGADVEIGPGSVVAAGGQLTTNVRIGAHVIVNVACTISHDTTVADGATLSPAVRLNGDVTIGPRTLLGTAAVVVRGHSVGADCVVGAGAVVVRDVPDGAVVAGVPARPLRTARGPRG